MDFRDFKDKTWIDWVKMIVAIDIAIVGFGLIIGQDIHFLSHIFGFLTRIPMGVMYIFISILILKRVFPSALHVDPHDTAKVSKIDHDMNDGIREGKNIIGDFFRFLNKLLNRFIDWVDYVLDRIAHFFEKRHREVKKEMADLMKNNKNDNTSDGK